MFSNKPHLKHTLHSIGQQAMSVTTRLTDIKRTGPRREAELYAQLGDLNRKLVELELAAAHLVEVGPDAPARGTGKRLRKSGTTMPSPPSPESRPKTAKYANHAKVFFFFRVFRVFRGLNLFFFIFTYNYASEKILDNEIGYI